MRPTALVLGLALLVLVAACGEENEPAAAPAAPAAPATVEPSGLSPEELPTLALSIDDLPEGFSLRGEGAVPTTAPVLAGFRRAFDPGETRLGGSVVADVTSDVALFESPEEAETALNGVLAALLGEEVERNFAELVRVSVGIEATNLQGQTLASETIGDGAVVAQARFDTDAGRAEAVLVVVRVGPLHHAIFFLGPVGEVQVDDAVELAEAVVPRLRLAAEGEFAA